jgi:hypothetical protein
MCRRREFDARRSSEHVDGESEAAGRAVCTIVFDQAEGPEPAKGARRGARVDTEIIGDAPGAGRRYGPAVVEQGVEGHIFEHDPLHRAQAPAEVP